jgi:hypothetical protein
VASPAVINDVAAERAADLTSVLAADLTAFLSSDLASDSGECGGADFCHASVIGFGIRKNLFCSCC